MKTSKFDTLIQIALVALVTASVVYGIIVINEAIEALRVVG